MYESELEVGKKEQFWHASKTNVEVNLVQVYIYGRLWLVIQCNFLTNNVELEQGQKYSLNQILWQ